MEKLMDKTKNLNKEVKWEKKVYVPKYRRIKNQ